MRRTDILGVKYDNITLVEAVERAMRITEAHECAYAVTPNSEIVLEACKNRALSTAIEGAELVLADGIGVIYASHILGTPLKQKVNGIDFASALMARMSAAGQSVYLFGAKPGVAELAAKNISNRYPGLRVVGTSDGYFADDTEIIEKINAAAPDLLIVCLGFPKQEIWMHQNAGKLNVGLMAGLGGTLDVYAGVAELAPQKWRDMGFEWLYRLIKDPKRIKRMIKLPGIIFMSLWYRIKG